MIEEIPIENEPHSAAERAMIEKLSDVDLKVIDAAILANCSSGWFKVARVMGDTKKALTDRFAGLSHVFYTRRLIQLVEQGRLESQGDLRYMRFSEVRLSS